jgi:hypothetical protein
MEPSPLPPPLSRDELCTLLEECHAEALCDYYIKELCRTAVTRYAYSTRAAYILKLQSTTLELNDALIRAGKK